MRGIPNFSIPDSRTTTLKFLTPKKPATHLQRLWCFKCSWAAAIAYHQKSSHKSASTLRQP
uniref:SFRICE_025723 n=1 Tax=Spodoptera frugiperda TaxID=7108 RepID=A0A2H1WI75_SPOFR